MSVAHGIACAACAKDLPLEANVCYRCGKECDGIGAARPHLDSSASSASSSSTAQAPVRLSRDRMSSSDDLRFKEALGENEFLSNRIQELESLNCKLKEENDELTASMGANMRLRDRAWTLGQPPLGDADERQVPDDAEWRSHRAQALWQKAAHGVRLAVRTSMRKAQVLEVCLSMAKQRCRDMSSEIVQLRGMLQDLTDKNIVQETALQDHQKVLHECRDVHQQEKEKLVDTIQQLEEQMSSFAFGMGSTRASSLLSEELADAIRDNAALTDRVSELEASQVREAGGVSPSDSVGGSGGATSERSEGLVCGEQQKKCGSVGEVERLGDELRQAHVRTRALEVQLADASAANEEQARLQAEFNDRASHLEDLLSNLQCPEGEEASQGQLWQTIVELQRQLVMSRKEADKWKDRANRPWWQSLSTAFCTTARETKGAVRAPPPNDDSGADTGWSGIGWGTVWGSAEQSNDVYRSGTPHDPINT